MYPPRVHPPPGYTSRVPTKHARRPACMPEWVLPPRHRCPDGLLGGRRPPSHVHPLHLTPTRLQDDLNDIQTANQGGTPYQLVRGPASLVGSRMSGHPGVESGNRWVPIPSSRSSQPVVPAAHTWPAWVQQSTHAVTSPQMGPHTHLLTRRRRIGWRPILSYPALGIPRTAPRNP